MLNVMLFLNVFCVRKEFNFFKHLNPILLYSINEHAFHSCLLELEIDDDIICNDEHPVCLSIPCLGGHLYKYEH